MKNSIVFILIAIVAFSCTNEKAKEAIRRIDRPESSILKGVYVPEGKDLFYTSGLVSEVLNANASAGDMSKYGNTYEQSIGALQKIKETIEAEGYSMNDVFFLRVYLAPNETGEIDWDAWFKAYGEYFNNDENPNKVARSTIGVYKLARPELLVEVEAVAAK
ncbi:Enamine deaminase RidA, house cleaning of reactive enamine intermediates, YjgF/YER057c/UK114 family [Marivirga sericea]|uniref:Enamine deaminase RidA, house cleaning of reactive enamine intermediates, YjgF/YER057c/UK114 family n=2 Tax=Marivirga sericea TaxID=1028 RepID=A0A1X7JLC0_9BACT|nr:Enamine deaminase RidA, house cleaning of reactive enamine intermediates, YjgF/YER057c/UK114 family [Marivirga sericea]